MLKMAILLLSLKWSSATYEPAQLFAQFYKKSNNVIQLNPSLVYIRKWDQLVETMMKAIMVRQLQLFKQHSVKL